MDVGLEIIYLVLLFRNFFRGGPLRLGSVSFDTLELLGMCSAHNGRTALRHLVEVVTIQIAELTEALDRAHGITLGCLGSN